MNKKLTSFVALIIMLAASVTASADDGFCDFRPYIGLDAQLRHMPFKKGFGNPPLNSNYAQGNLFAGLQFNRYIGVEVGYELSRTKHKLKNLHPEDSTFGVNLSNNPNIIPIVAELLFPVSSLAKNKISGWNLNLTAALPIFEDCLDLIGSIGISQLKTRIDLTFPTLFGGPNPTSNFVKFPRKTKSVPRAMLGLQYMATCNIGLRFTLNWEQTSKFDNLTFQNVNLLNIGVPLTFTAKLENSINYGIGLFWRF